jgi:TonB family protein
MSNESPPGSSRPRAGGEFTWPPPTEELDAIEVIRLKDSPPVAAASATPPTTPTTPAHTSARPPLPVLPATLVVPPPPTPPAVVPIKALGRRLHAPRRDDLAYLGVTLTSALAIAVAATLQLSDRWYARHAGSEQLAHATAPVTSPAPVPPTPATPLAASPVANVALLQLLEKGPNDVARAALDATTPPVTAFAGAAPSVTPVTPAKTTDDADDARRTRSDSRVATRPQQTLARRGTYARRPAANVAPPERRDRNRSRDLDRYGDRDGSRESVAARAAVAAIASPPLRLPESYVQPRVVSQGTGRHRGKVVLAVQVRPNGRVGDVEVLSKGDDRGYDDLERAAVSAVKRWRYRPALRDGVPTPSRVKVVVNFS